MNSGITRGESISGNDPLLHPFLTAGDPEAQSLLEQLITGHAEPALQRAMRKKMYLSFAYPGADSPENNVEDICSEARLNVVRTLRRLRNEPDQQPIRDFKNYVGSIFFQVWDKQLRMQHPARWRLKNQVRYLLRRHSTFGLWNTEDGVFVAGLARWRGKDADSKATAYQQIMAGNIPIFFNRKTTETRRLMQVIKSIFEISGCPFELDDLVTAVAHALGIPETGTRHPDPDALLQIADSRPDIFEQHQNREYLRALWNEIRELPLRQRMALLFSLRDSTGRALVPLFPLLGIAAIADIACVLEITYQQMLSFWNRLPMDDSAISELLAISRQQVINLRKSARERLMRRTQEFSTQGNSSAKSTSLDKQGGGS